MTLLLCLVLAGSAVLAAVLTPVSRAVCVRAGLVDRPGSRKVHTRTTPYGGGPAIFVGAVAPLVAAGLAGVAWGASGLPTGVAGLLPTDAAALVNEHLAGVRAQAPRLWALLATTGWVFAVGMVDDARDLGPWTKLACEILGALALALSGIVLEWPGPEWLEVTVTVLWMVAVCNAVNLLDNVDGQAAGVVCTVSVLFMLVALLNGPQIFVAAVLAGLAGAALGFLVHNWPPASVFMGDAGSLTLGWLLGGATVLASFYRETGGEPRALPPSVLLPLVVMAVPFYDSLTVVVLRARAGVPVYRGDTRHFSHRLMGLGLTTRESLAVILGLTALCGGAGLLLFETSSDLGTVLVAVLVGAVLGITALLERAGARALRRRADGSEAT